MICPYCSEGIKHSAQKCRHCGEWLNGRRSGSSADNGTSNARAITKGLKQKQWHDFTLSVRGLLALLVACIAGSYFKNAFVGFFLFLGLAAFFRWQYFRE